MLVDLDDGVPAAARAHTHPRDVDARVAADVEERVAVGAHDARVRDVRAAAGKRDGLIESLAAAVRLDFAGIDRLAAGDDVVDLVNEVEVKRAEAQDPGL